MEFSLHKSLVVNSGTSVTFANYNVYLTCLTIINVNGTNSFTLNMCLILKKNIIHSFDINDFLRIIVFIIV